jgi:microcystin-dependent protein
MDPFVAEIRIFPFNFAPKGWAFCDGQVLPISQNTALFSLLGTTYGGDGKSTFQLPNLQGNAPMFYGQGPGLSLYDIGEMGGSPTVTLIDTQLASHNHGVNATTVQGTSNDPSNNLLCEGHWTVQGNNGPLEYYSAATNPPVQMGFNTIGLTGNSFPHNNLMPYLTLNFCIALQGVYPPRT